MPGELPKWLPGGFTGVDVFLVISGFLVTSILVSRKLQPGYTFWSTLKDFYLSRLKRIAPAYFVMLIVVALTAAILATPDDFEVFQDALDQAIWFNSNKYFSQFGDYFAPVNHEQPLPHTWSLAIELQFYILVPWLILLLPMGTLKWVLATFLILLTLISEYNLRLLGLERTTYYSLTARLPEFFAGCLCALHLSSIGDRERVGRWHGGLGLGLVILAATMQPKLGPFPGIAVFLPVAGAAMVLVSTFPNSAKRILTLRALVWIGALSYPLYLWHWPALAFLRYFTGTSALNLSFSLLFVLLTFLLALISFYLVEQPLRVFRKSSLRGWCYATLILAVTVTPKTGATTY